MAVHPSPEQWSPHDPATEIAPGFWRLPMPIPGHNLQGVCAFLVQDRDGYLMIDSGMAIPACIDALDGHLAAIGVPISAIHTIVATHCHPDHLGQASRLRALSGARIWLHGLDAPLVHPEHPAGDADLPSMVTWLTRYGFPPEEAGEARQSVDAGQGASYLLAPDRLLEGGETVVVGAYRLEVVWTPGHTPGHVCLFEPARGLLLTGDHLFAKAAPNVRLMSYSPIDTMGRYVASLEKIAALGADLALPAHGEPFGQVADRAGQVIRHQLDRRERLRTMLTPRPQTAYELAQVVWGPGARTTWDTFHPRLRRNAAMTLAAHLEQLAEDGEVARHTGEAGVVGFASPR
jgi:glyoxylase-like metal-dependent hydrolase (beta-lactamase superfamily II)